MLFAFTCSIATAQDISLGVKAGINYGKTKSSNSEENKLVDPIIGPNFGIVADIPINEKFSVQPELSYFTTGYKMTYSMEGYSSEYNGKLNYLGVPIMGKYYIQDGF